MPKMKISNKELIDELIGETTHFPKYTTQIINLANQNAQGTRPSVVGQLSDLIQECPYRSYDKWKEWYLKKYPRAMDDATNRIVAMVDELRKAIDLIDKKMIRRWVKDLVIVKTFIGLRFQEIILKRISEQLGSTYRLAKPNEESKGIDGFIGKTPVSIKPTTYKTKRALPEAIGTKIVYYEKTKEGIEIDAEDFILGWKS